MKILYGIAGEGLGHATRSEVIIRHLLANGHEIRIITSGKAFDFLSKRFPEIIKKIEGFSLNIEENKLNIQKSITGTLLTIPKKLGTNTPAFLSPFKKFKPDIVISDFESFTYLYAKVHRKPIIAIDNIHTVNRCKIDYPKKFRKLFLFSKTIISSKLPACNQYLLSSFFNPEPKRKNTQIVPPIIRPEILSAIPEKQDHILVYLSGKAYPSLINILKNISENFIVYGFNKNDKEKNIQFREFSSETFIEDLRTAKAVISTSGYSLISESIFLKKPFFAIPLLNQFEQILNAHYLKKLGFGQYHLEITEGHLKNFLKKCPKYENALSKYKQNENKELFKKLEEILKKLSK
ncbi:MAG: glycosyltransferase family protein [Candidatus Gracilibacteria bacterium]|jgi:uncharacterized protein (TIGR00661 family)|nr:glycosyltransferase family protein [Candidatus Gracilibacteria bacterium]